MKNKYSITIRSQIQQIEPYTSGSFIVEKTFNFEAEDFLQLCSFLNSLLVEATELAKQYKMTTK